MISGMEQGFVLVTRPLADPDATALVAEMRAEMQQVYDRPDAGPQAIDADGSR